MNNPMHLTDSQLRVNLDHGLREFERPAAEHLAACADCRRRAEVIAARAQRIAAHLAALDSLPGSVPADAAAGLARFRSRRDVAQQKETFMFSRIFNQRFRPAWGVLAVAALVAVSLGFAPVRAWAGEFLGLFRVQQITVLSIDTTRLDDLSGNTTLAKQLSQLLSDSVTVTKEPGKPTVVASAAEASQLAGFNVRLWSDSPTSPQLTVQDGTAFQFVVRRDLAQSILNDAGRSDLQLPASLDGATISVQIPAGVSAGYGDCPQIDEQTGEAVAQRGSAGRRFINCIILAEGPSPTVTTPPDVDLPQLAEIGLQFSGMTAEQARELSHTVDWTSTLVVPLPRNAASYEQVEVDGVTGYMIRRPTDDAPQFALLWVKDGIIYAIGGLGNNADKALAMGNSLK
ncbi:MAG: hypothetical protein HY260_23710 [Chloroflexi bacterium]|nr:hypothetical protein [Chloroflexota bacterium]